MTGAPLDDEDDNPRERPTLTHAPRGRDVSAEHWRVALRSLEAAQFAAVTEPERIAAMICAQTVKDKMGALGIIING